MKIFSLALILAAGLAYGAGKELEGTRAAANTPCPTPEEARAKMSVPDGYEVRCWAHEPMVQNPVAMAWDARGRLWVVEAYEYPEGTPLPEEKRPFGGEAKDDKYHPMPKLEAVHPKDRVIILEDTNNDGEADKRTVFVEGLNLASAIICGDNGVYVGQQPHLLHFRDNDHDDKPDEWRVILTGFGREDTHELVNSFTWGPDGWLYMTHGVFTNSKVRRPGEPESNGFKFDAGIGRCRPTATGKDSAWEFEVFADGTSNPWGCDYDERGNFFVSACVIDHFFHMAPGGIYVRQGGAPENPYSYELLPSIVTHKHFRAAYAGIQIYQGGVYPKDTWGHAFIGNIHDNAIHEEVLTPVGSTFKCEPRRDFLRANDGWFRPVSTRTGPDGNLWVMDWCDKYPCYQNAKANPEGVDREKGRIWRVVTKGAGKESRPTKDMDLAKLDTPALVKLLGDSNNWMRRWARRELSERKDETIRLTLEQLTKASPSTDLLWTLWQTRLLSDEVLLQLEKSSNPALRAWTAIFVIEKMNSQLSSGPASEFEKAEADALKKELEAQKPDSSGGYPISTTSPNAILTRLAADLDPTVRVAVAVADRLSKTGSLTVSHRPTGMSPAGGCFPNTCLSVLIKSSVKSEGNLLPFAIWQALEPTVPNMTGEDAAIFATLMPKAGDTGNVLTYKSMRRLCDTRDTKNLDLALDFLTKIKAHDVLLAHALDGLEKGQESGVIKPNKDFAPLFAELASSKNEDVRKHAQNLATLWGDKAAIERVVSQVRDAKAPDAQRIAAVQTLKKVKSDAASQAFATLLSAPKEQSAALTVEVIRAAADMGGDSFIAPLTKLAASKDYGIQLAALGALSNRDTWTHALLDAIQAKTVSAMDFPASVRRQLATSKDKAIRDHAFKVLGAWKDSSDDVKALIAAKKKACLEGEPDLAAGKLIFQTTCMVCHTFFGGGQKVGPELIGSGRSNLDALLANVIDPNQIIGNGYENFIISTKDNRTLMGRVTEDTPSHVKLLAIGGAETVIPRDQIAKSENTHQSLMPMGFGGLPDDQFRNLVWYVLAPPDEGPLTADKKKQLSTSIDGPVKKVDKNHAIDWESVSLWNPKWKVTAPEFDRTPVKLAEYHGRNNVLIMHPFEDKKTPAVLEQKIKVDAAKSKLKFSVASDDRGDWQLRVVINGKEVKRMDVGHENPRWHDVVIDLADRAGMDATIRLEAHATGWSWEFSYWNDVRIE